MSSFPAFSQSETKPKIGNCAITWGNDYFAAIHESAALGFKGIQLRGNAFKAHHEKPDSLIAVLKLAGLQVPIMSGSGLGSGKKPIEAELSQLEKEAEFLKRLGGEFLQVVGPPRDAQNPPSKEQLLAFAQLMNQAGELVSGKGIRLVFHNHMHNYGQTPDEIDILAQAIDPNKVGFLLDIAHCFQGGGNPTEVFKKWQNNIRILHLKDVRPNDKKPAPFNYAFTELGRGQVDMKSFFDALKSSKFKSWAMVELDAVPDPGRSAKESAEISKRFLVEKMDLWN